MSAGKKSPHSSSCTSKEPSSHTESGGAYIKDSNICYGYAKLQGKRAVMEDCHEAKTWIIPEQNNQRVVFFGVFDGHGGRKAADYVQKYLVNNLKDHPKLLSDTKLAIREVYLQTDEAYINMEDNGQSRDAGSTASTAVLVGKKLVVANVGDSRVVLCRRGKAHPLSTDHKPSKLEEQKRIKDAGGVIMWAGTWRVGGVLAVTRAFGDKMLKPYVSAEPEIVEEIVYPCDEFLVLASDGLWDVVSNDEAVQIVQRFPKEKPEEAAKSLTDEAYKRGSADNITCIVVRFLHDSKNIEQASESHSLTDVPAQDDDDNCCRWCMDYISLRSVFPPAILPLKQAQSIRRHYSIRDQAHPEVSPAFEPLQSGTVEAGAGVP